MARRRARRAPSDRRRIAAAQIHGVTAAFGHLRRITQDEALAEIREILAGWPTDEHAGILAVAAEGYVREPRDANSWWYDAAIELLSAAGADLDEARRLAAQPLLMFSVPAGAGWTERATRPATSSPAARPDPASSHPSPK